MKGKRGRFVAGGLTSGTGRSWQKWTGIFLLISPFGALIAMGVSRMLDKGRTR